MGKLRFLFASLVLFIALFTGLYFFWPEQSVRVYNPVYSDTFDSTVVITQKSNHRASPSLTGLVSNQEGEGIPALLRLYRLPREKRKIDIAAQQYTDIYGDFSLEVAPGTYELLVYKGPEYEYLRYSLTLAEGESANAEIHLARIINMANLGWFSGDPHQHSAFYDGKDPLDKLLVANAAVGLHFSVQTDHNEVGQNPIAKAFADESGLNSDSGYPYHVIGGDEVTTSIGHMIAWEPKDSSGEYVHIDHSAPKSDAPLDEKIVALQRIQSDLQRYAKLKVINHPAGGNVAYRTFGEKRGDSFMDVDFDWIEHRGLVLGFDATESWNGGSGFMDGMYYFGAEVMHPFEAMEQVFHQWFRLLNSGAKFPSIGSSDTHDAYVSGYLQGYDTLVQGVKTLFLGKMPMLPPRLAHAILDDLEGALLYQHLDEVEYQLEEIALLPGTARTYIYTGGELTTERLIANVGRSFITNGPLLFAEVDGAMPGEVASIVDLNTLKLEVVSHKPLAKLLVIADGELIHQRPLKNVLHFEEMIELELSNKKWLLVYVEGQDNYAHAFTNPIYLQP